MAEKQQQVQITDALCYRKPFHLMQQGTRAQPRAGNALCMALHAAII